MQKMRTPEAGEIQVVTLLGTTTFIGWTPADKLELLLDSFEERMSITVADRTDQTAHASIRIQVARLLRGADAERAFSDRLAAACLWLAMRHWSRGGEMRKGLAQQMASSGSAIVSVSIADPTPEGTMPDTAWAFMIDSRVHDGRAQLAGLPSDQVLVVGRAVTG